MIQLTRRCNEKLEDGKWGYRDRPIFVDPSAIATVYQTSTGESVVGLASGEYVYGIAEPAAEIVALIKAAKSHKRVEPHLVPRTNYTTNTARQIGDSQ